MHLRHQGTPAGIPQRATPPHRKAGQFPAARRHTQALPEHTIAYQRWHQKAQGVELRSAEALSKIEDMNTFIVFYQNQPDYRAITEYDDRDVPLQVGLLLESLYASGAETTGLAEVMSAD